MRPHFAAQIGVSPRYMEGHRTSEKPFSFGARPRSDVLNEASNGQSAFELRTLAVHCVGFL